MITRRGFIRQATLFTGVASVGLWANGLGCQPQIAQPSGKKARTVGLQLPWRNNAENAPFHVGMAAGYYAEEGLEIKLVEGGPGVPAHTNVLRGDAEIGCAASIGAMIPWLTGDPLLPFVSTFAILQLHPLGFVTLEKNLTPEQQSRPLKPEDLRGKRIGVQGEQEINALLRKHGMNPDKDVKIIRISGENPADLLTTTVDYASYWIVNQPIGLDQQGLKWKALMFAEHGVPLYADVIFTTRERLQKEPEVMRAFLRATTKAMRKMIDDPEFAIQATLKYGGGYDTEDTIRRRFKIQNERKMMESSDTDKYGLGWMDKAKIAASVQFFVEGKEVKPERVPKVEEMMSMEYLK